MSFPHVMRAAGTLLILLSLCFPGVATPATAATAGGPGPNFVFVLVDDLGWRDPAFNGTGFYETPHLDRLRQQGMWFPQAYAASPYCSPSRAAIQTGRNPARSGITMFIGYSRAGVMRQLVEPLNVPKLPADEVTIGQALREAGYATGFIGKWHLGADRESFPDCHGYDHVRGVATGAGAGRYFSPYTRAAFAVLNETNLPDGPPGEFIEDRLVDESLNFIRTQAQARRPFLLFHSCYAMHALIDARDDLVAKYRSKLERMAATGDPRSVPEGYVQFSGRGVALEQRNPVFAAMLEMLDASLGRLFDGLEQLDIADNTVVVLTGDNGGLATNNTAVARHAVPVAAHDTANAPLRGGKGYLFEGGIRVPLLVRWSGRVAPGSVCDTPVALTDFYATFLELAGQAPRPNQALDSVSLAPLLRGTGALAPRSLFWHMPQYRTTGDFPGSVIRQGDFKLIHFYEEERSHLYDLRQDFGEQRDLAQVMPEKTAELRRELESWRAGVAARSLSPNPNYDASVDPRLHPPTATKKR